MTVLTLLALIGAVHASEPSVTDGTAATLPSTVENVSIDAAAVVERSSRNGSRSGGSSGARGGGSARPPAAGGGGSAPPSAGSGRPPSNGGGGAPPNAGSGRPPSNGGGGAPPNAGSGRPPSGGNGAPPQSGSGRPPANGNGNGGYRPPPSSGNQNPPGGRPGGYRPPAAAPRPVPAHPAARPGMAVNRPGVRSVRPVVTYRSVRPYHGVFVYGPRPVTHVHYGGSNVSVSQADLPTRKVDRNNTLAVGLRAGSVYGGYAGAAPYADLGFGVNMRYRPDEMLGFELALASYAQNTPDSHRQQTVGQASVELFAFPWTRVSPYVLTGLTVAGRDFSDAYYTSSVQQYESQGTLYGLHGGIGLELAIGDRFGIDLEGRYIGYMGQSTRDAALPGSFQTTAGVMYHF